MNTSYFTSVLLIVLVSFVPMRYSAKISEGFPVGYLSDCPGSNKTAIITPNTLKYLTITVVGPGGILNSRQKKYNYYQTKQLIKDPYFDLRKKTFMYVVGYLDSTDFLLGRVIGKLYKDLGYNILLLDTNRFTTVVYPVAVRYIRTVGVHAAKMLLDLTNQGLDPKRLEMAAISLGAQTMSFIAKNYQRLSGKKVSRLTAFDPSGPCFRNLGPEGRLDKSDADFVDVINTNIDGFGMATPVGHVNFYVNGGEFQPGEILITFCPLLCSHLRAYTLWLAALQYPDSFIAIQCDSLQQARERNCYDRKPQVTTLMGLKSDKSKRGIFYLSTRSSYPFYMGLKGIKRKYDFYDVYLRSLNEKDVIKM